MERLLTTSEAAAYLRVNRHRIGEYVRDKALPVVRLHETAIPKFRLADLDAFIESKIVGPEVGPTESETIAHFKPELAQKDRGQNRVKRAPGLAKHSWRKEFRHGR